MFCGNFAVCVPLTLTVACCITLIIMLRVFFGKQTQTSPLPPLPGSRPIHHMATVNRHLQLLDQLYVYNRFNCETPAPGSDPENKIFMVPTFSSKPVKLLQPKSVLSWKPVVLRGFWNTWNWPGFLFRFSEITGTGQFFDLNVSNTWNRWFFEKIKESPKTVRDPDLV